MSGLTNSSFVVPVPVFTNAALLGAIIAAIWRKYWLKNWDIYGYAVAAGMIAGEGLGGVIGAALQLGGVSGDILGKSEPSKFLYTTNSFKEPTWVALRLSADGVRLSRRISHPESDFSLCSPSLWLADIHRCQTLTSEVRR